MTNTTTQTQNLFDALSFYRKHSPLHAGSKQYMTDRDEIKASSRPVSVSEQLVSQRKDEVIDSRIEKMLREQQGSRTRRFKYNQEAAIGLEHLQSKPFDPITQVPIWHEMIMATTGGKTIPKGIFHKQARAILSQEPQFNGQY